jgi:VIT1/CCC1 family predicted Fe2+/Mn2+ transporter
MDMSPTISSGRVLEPIERISEVLFGLIMVLTFTGSLSAAESGRAEVRTMLIGAIGCNLAWGLIDAIMYLMASLADRASERRLVASVRGADTEAEAASALAGSMPATAFAVLTPGDVSRICAELARLPGNDKAARLQLEDFVGAFAVFLLVFFSTLPVILPFIFVQDAQIALRVSNAIAVAMMLMAGYAFGRLAGYRPWLTAGSMVVLGSLLVGVAIALGG